MKESIPKILPSLSVFEAESMLIEAMERLRKSEKNSSIQDKLIGDYWQETWRRAPFEECLTFKQLASLNVDVLLKKRSFDTEKMIALSYAVRRGLDSENSIVPNSVPESSAQVKTKITEPSKQAWKSPITDLSSTLTLFLLGFASEISLLPTSHSFTKVGVAILNQISPLHFASLWFSHFLFSSETLLGLDIHTDPTKKEFKATVQQISKIIYDESPELYLHWSTALTGPGASESTLLNAYTLKPFFESFVKDFGIILCKCLGAKRVIIKDTPLPHHWAFSPETADKIALAFAPGLSAKKPQALETLSLPFPFFDLEELLTHIRRLPDKGKVSVKKAAKNPRR